MDSVKPDAVGVFPPFQPPPALRNLYFVGASTHPGTGLPTAMVSGRLVAQRVMDEINHDSV